jgi:hypothetical protein
MGEEVTGFFSSGNAKTSVVVVVAGKTDPKCLAWLMLELKKLAKHCGLTVKNLKVEKKVKRKAKKK